MPQDAGYTICAFPSFLDVLRNTLTNSVAGSYFQGLEQVSFRHSGGSRNPSSLGNTATAKPRAGDKPPRYCTVTPARAGVHLRRSLHIGSGSPPYQERGTSPHRFCAVTPAKAGVHLRRARHIGSGSPPCQERGTSPRATHCGPMRKSLPRFPPERPAGFRRWTG